MKKILAPIIYSLFIALAYPLSDLVAEFQGGENLLQGGSSATVGEQFGSAIASIFVIAFVVIIVIAAFVLIASITYGVTRGFNPLIPILTMIIYSLLGLKLFTASSLILGAVSLVGLLIGRIFHRKKG